MKKIMFLVHFYDVNKSSGIIEKIINQSTAMNNKGILYKTYIFVRKSQYEYTKPFQKYDFVDFIPLDFYEEENNKVKKLLRDEKVYIEYIKKGNQEKGNYNYIYVRMNPLYHNFVKFCKTFKDHIIFEHNSIEETEYKANKSKFQIYTNLLYKTVVRKCACLYVCVSKEIYEYQKKIYKEIKGIIIPNGINVKSFELRNVPEYDGTKLNMIFVGNIRYWHGLERMITSIENYNGDVKIVLNIVGDFNQKDYLTSLINNNKTKNEINMIGYKNKIELNDFFNEAHVAVGCLGGYKKNINHGSVLKNREYFSRGIPVIYSEIDDDISVIDNAGLFMSVPNDDSEIKMEEIISFVEKFYKDPIVNTKKIRLFAEENLDFETKIEKLKDSIYELN